MTSTNSVRALVGSRLSTFRGEQQTGHQTQREAGERYAAAHGWTVVGTFEDLDVSASVSPWDRPDLGPWLTERADEWDALIFAKVDRAFRSLKDCADVAEWAKQRGRLLVFVDDSITLDYRTAPESMGAAMAKVFLTLASTFAELELGRMRDRVRGAHRYMRSRSRWAGGKPPYGFRSVDAPGGGRTLEIDPDTAPAVRLAGDLALKGLSLWEICRALDAEGYATPKGGVAWNHTAVRTILVSPATQGYKLMSNGKQLARGDDGMPIRFCEGIFTDDEWSRIQDAMAKRSQARERSHGASALLGIVYCGECHRRLYRVVNDNYVSPVTGQRHAYAYYRCRQGGGMRGCPGQTFYADELTRGIDQIVADELSGTYVTNHRWEPGEDHTAELERVISAMDSIRAERDDGLYDYSGGGDEYRDRLLALVTARQRLEALPYVPGHWVDEPTDETYAEAYQRMNTDERRRLLVSAELRVYCFSEPKGFAVTIGERQMRKVFPNYTPPERKP